MLQSIEGIVDHPGKLRIPKRFKLPKSRRIMLTIWEEPSEDEFNLALLSELALAYEWGRPEEGEAWSHLAELPSL
jgi:hypothetical protein